MKRPYHFHRETQRMRDARARMDALAEHVAEGGSIAGFARESGMSERGAQMAWAKVVAGMGAQAV